MNEYSQCLKDHRNLCRVIDCEIGEKSQDSPDSESTVFVISESYNLSLYDLYCTNQAEKTRLQEDFLIEISFQVLKALDHLSRQNNKRTFRGFPGGFKGMLRM